ncbi:hypothetical protein cypCar_00011266 [Cyprinus carpio]|nr:hypothetical protein cypCar_00011266 [Cyprinus carpio]
MAADSIYLVTVSSQVVGGKTETLCAQIHEPKEPLSIVVTLRTDDRNLTILQQGSIKKDFYKCVPFKVPVVTVESVASVDVAIQGAKTSLNKTTKILINPPQNLLFIQSDKPIYKPGQTIKFRIVSLDSNFLPRNQVFQTVELRDPSSNRIGQWLNQTTRIGILDLSHSMSPEAAQGFYTITAWDAKNQQISHSFEIKEYVLPKYEVNIDFPSILTFQDKEVTLKVCAKYTYGKPVLGSVNAEVCSQSYGYYWRRPSPDMINICKKYSMTTDKTGCGSQVVNMTEFGLTSAGSLQVNCNVEESGTGITMQGSTSAQLTSDYVYVNFEDTPDTYRPGMVFKGKFVVTNSQSRPMKNESVIVYAHYDDKMINVTLKTDINGTARFSFNTLDWSEKPVQLQVYHKGGIERTDFEAFRYYPSGYHYIRPFHSKSKSFLMLTNAPEKLSCNSDATVTASYIIQGSALKTGQKTLDFFYIVLSRGSMAQNGRLSVSVNSGRENRGELRFSLKSMAALTPYAQVVVYTVLPSGEAVADSMNFPIEECLPNKVSLKFSSPTALPGERTSLNLKASPGSLCSVRAIDQSVLLLRPEAELDAASVLQMLPVQILSGYPYNIEEWDPNPCRNPWEIIPFAEPARRKRSRFYYPYYDNKNDVYNIFRGVGIKITTNSDVKAPVVCRYYETMFRESAVDNARMDVDLAGPEIGFGSKVSNPPQKIRKFFPETWIWDLIPVGPQETSVSLTLPKVFVKDSAKSFVTVLGEPKDMLAYGGVSNEVTLSAYITAALLELGVQRTDPMVVRSLTCLRESSSDITNTYVTALLSYTFTLAGDEQMRQNLISNLDNQARREGVGRYWTLANNVQPTGSLEVETSAYVLLALLSGPTLPRFGLNYSAGIVHWLSKQQNAYGGFSSTQDTVVALQALAKYSAAIYNPEGSITVTVTSPSGQKNQFTVNQNNRLLYQEKRYNGTRMETNMVIINVRFLSGFKPDETSLQALREDPTIKRVDLDEDRVIFYLDSLKKNQVKSISLQLVQEVQVQNLKPAVVIVYDYYKISDDLKC